MTLRERPLIEPTKGIGYIEPTQDRRIIDTLERLEVKETNS